MSTKEENLEELKKLSQKMSSDSPEVLEARILEPSKEVEESLTSFVIGRLERIQKDAEFTDLIRMHIRNRLPEASFTELKDLLHETSIDNNQATADISKLFRNETSGKTLLDNLKDNSVENTASKLYNSTEDKSVLQAVSYLSQIMSKISDKKE